jgi:DNA-binding transcriptional regulator YiaG
MTPDEFKAIRKTLFGTQAAAEALGVVVQIIKAWEHGRRGVPEMAVKLIQCLEQGGNASDNPER